MPKTHENGGELPRDLLDELARMEPPSEETLRRYDYLKKDLIDAFRYAAEAVRAAEVARETSGAEVVFSLAGKLLHAAATVAKRVFEEPVPVPVLARTVTKAVRRAPAPRDAGEKPRLIPIAAASKDHGPFRIAVCTCRCGDETHVELNVSEVQTGADVRPFDVTIRDADGKDSVVHVDVAESAPRLPDLRPGLYVFAFSWRGGHDDLRVEFRKDA